MSRVLGIDPGRVRVGLALSDALQVTVTPLEVVKRADAVARVEEIVKESDVATIVVGLPTSLRGGEGPSAEDARSLGEEIRSRTGCDVVYHDERFTSRMAESNLLEKGMKRRDRRRSLDMVAAALILQDFLDNHDFRTNT